MLFLPYLRSSAQRGETTSPSTMANPPFQPEREPLRHIIIGSPEGVRSAINHLHILNYVEQLQWSRLLTIPESGIVITPAQGDVLSYLLRYRQV